MRILHTVEFYYPSVGGSQEVARQISERLAKLGHEVTVATTKLPGRKSLSHNGVKIVEFEIEGNAVRGIKGEKKRYQDFLCHSNFDVVMNYAAQQWATDLAFDVMDKIQSVKVLVPCGFSGLYDPLYEQYFATMPDVMKKYDATIYLSDDYRDINFARDHKIKNLHVIPNGAGADEFEQPISFSIRDRLHIPHSSFLILSVGSHTGMKGHAEAIEIFKKSKIRNSMLLIVANDFGEGCAESCKREASKSRRSLDFAVSRKRLFVKNLSRIETVAAYREADLFFFPSNIEASPLVLFEAMASRLPFLTTDVGNAKEIIKWSSGGLLLPTKKDESGMSHADINKSINLVEQWRKTTKLKRYGESGYRAWRSKFTWEIIARRYESLYKELADGHR